MLCVATGPPHPPKNRNPLARRERPVYIATQRYCSWEGVMAQQEGLLCWNCSRATGLMGRAARMDSCDNCLADLRCCRGCRHFDPTRRSQCRETISQPVGNKEKSNFCDFFQNRDAFKRPGGVSSEKGDKADRKSNFDDLFKD